MDNISALVTTAPTPTGLPSAEPDAGGMIYTGLHGFRLFVHTAVMLLGLPGNSLILCVYWTKRQKSSTHVLIMSLAWADLTVCLLKVLDITAEAFLLAGQRYPKVIYILLPIENTAVGATIMITTFIAADRYDCVCRPHRRFFTTRRAKIAAVASTLMSFAINVPAFILVSTNSDSLVLRILLYSSQLVAYVILLFAIVLCYRRVYLTIRDHAGVNAIRPVPVRPRLPYGVPKPSESNNGTTDDKELWIPRGKPLSSCNPPLVHNEQLNPRCEISEELVPTRTKYRTEHNTNQNRTKTVACDNEILTPTSLPECGSRIINVNEAFDHCDVTPTSPEYTARENGINPASSQSTKQDKNVSVMNGFGTSSCQYEAHTKHKQEFDPYRERKRQKAAKEIGTVRKLSRVAEHEMVLHEERVPSGSSAGGDAPAKPITKVRPKDRPTTEEPFASRRRRVPRRLPNKVGISTRPWKKYDGSSLLQRKTTRMLFITSLVFLLSWLPYWIYVIGLLVDYSGVDVNETLQHILEEVKIIIFVNDVVNPLIYGIWNARFRKDCREVFRKANIC